MGALIDLTNRNFGKLKVIGIDHKKKTKYGSKIYWRCQCKCGNETVVSGSCLKSGHTKSCGQCGSILNIDDKDNCYGVTNQGVILDSITKITRKLRASTGFHIMDILFLI